VPFISIEGVVSKKGDSLIAKKHSPPKQGLISLRNRNTLMSDRILKIKANDDNDCVNTNDDSNHRIDRNEDYKSFENSIDLSPFKQYELLSEPLRKEIVEIENETLKNKNLKLENSVNLVSMNLSDKENNYEPHVNLVLDNSLNIDLNESQLSSSHDFWTLSESDSDSGNNDDAC